MRFPSKAIVEMLRRQYPVGTRVELVRMDDPQAPPIGTKGTVRGVDDIGSIMVAWDNGCGLSVAGMMPKRFLTEADMPIMPCDLSLQKEITASAFSR